MPNFFELLIIFLVLTNVSCLSLYIWEYNKRQKLIKDRFLTIDQAEQKSYNILHQAIKKAQALIGSAELEGIKVAATTKLQSEKFEKYYEKGFEQALKDMELKLSEITSLVQKQITQAQQDYLNFLSQARSDIEQIEHQQKAVTEQRVDQLLNSLQSRLWDFLVQIEQRTISSVEIELKSSKQLIDRYKQQQLALVDENIVAILERTLSQVLAKRLSLKDHLDLVYEALEKAKLEKFIA